MPPATRRARFCVAMPVVGLRGRVSSVAGQMLDRGGGVGAVLFGYVCRQDGHGAALFPPGRLGPGDPLPRRGAGRRRLVGVVGGRFPGGSRPGQPRSHVFRGIDLQYLDYTAAVAGFESGASAAAAPAPMHPSYQDRQGAPDPVLAAVDPALADHLASAWEAPFAAAGADRAHMFHLHHLTSQHDVVARRWPQVPVVAHLHGTELKLIEAIEAEPPWPVPST